MAGGSLPGNRRSAGQGQPRVPGVPCECRCLPAGLCPWYCHITFCLSLSLSTSVFLSCKFLSVFLLVCLSPSLSLSLFPCLSLCPGLSVSAFLFVVAAMESALSDSITEPLLASSPPGQPFDPSLLLAQATSNVVCSLTVGLRFPYEDDEFQAVVRAAGGILQGISSPWGQVRGWDPSPALLQGSCLPLPEHPIHQHLGPGAGPGRPGSSCPSPYSSTRCSPGSCSPFRVPAPSSWAT